MLIEGKRSLGRILLQSNPEALSDRSMFSNPLQSQNPSIISFHIAVKNRFSQLTIMTAPHPNVMAAKNGRGPIFRTSTVAGGWKTTYGIKKTSTASDCSFRQMLFHFGLERGSAHNDSRYQASAAWSCCIR